MLPVLIQNLIKRSKTKPMPIAKEEVNPHSDKFGTVVLCFLAVMVLIGLLLG